MPSKSSTHINNGGSACCRLPCLNGRAGRGIAQYKVERAISVGQAVGRAEGYRRFRLDGRAPALSRPTTGEGGGSEPVLAFSSRHKKARVPAHHKWTSIEVQGSDVTAGGTRACSNMAFYLRREQYCGAMLIAQQ